MKTIYKYELEITTLPQIIHRPAGADFLKLEVLQNKPVLYYLVQSDNKMIPEEIKGFETGQRVEGVIISQYAGTAVTDDHGSPYVIHFFFTRRPNEAVSSS